MIASGSADNTIRLWEVKTGRLLKTWEFPTAVKRVEFNEDGTQLLGVTEKRMGHLGSIVVLNIVPDVDAEQSDEKELTIVCDESKATVAGWSYLSKYIIAGHEDGSVSQYDAKVGPPSWLFLFSPSSCPHPTRTSTANPTNTHRLASSSKTSPSTS